MSTLQEYIKKLSVEKLKQALREHLDGTTVLPDETVAMISTELEKRNSDA